jgi:FkbM family methyltransferase
VTFTRRAIGAISRRLGRPELLSAFYAGARLAEREDLAITAVLAGLLKADGCYVDVGSNRGQVLADAVRIAPDGRHLAFEPIPALAAEVRRRFPAVDCRQMALGPRREKATFCHFTTLDGWSGLRRNPLVSDEQGSPEYFEVEVSTLDEELAGLRPDLVKVDVEGAELGVLQGAGELLARARPTILLEHVPQASALYGDSGEEIWDLLDGAGYRIMPVTGEGPLTRAEFAHGTGVVNWLATPRG